jgi:sugar/nucleoside kinase (ribokinase family)
MRGKDKLQFIINNRQLIVGIGSALVDILIHEKDEFLNKTGAVKGGMTLVDKKTIERTLALSSGNASIVPGGSACNTIVGIGKLGGAARFVGKCGKGEMGDLIESDLRKQNVEPKLFRSASPTGRVLSIISPDAQRSMFTYLGASAETRPEDISKQLFKDAAVVHIEGYLLFNPELIRAALTGAKSAGAKISLDLASFTVVEESKELLEQLVDSYVDVLIANEDEARAFTGYSDEHLAIEALSEQADVAVLKVGPRGSYISHAGNTIAVEPMGDGTALDTTGAGDMWAAGFLYGLVNGYPLEKSGQLGSACGYEVCQVVGANIPDEGWERIKIHLK